MHRPLLLTAVGSALVAASVATAAPDSALSDLSPRQKAAFGAHSLRSLVPAGEIKQIDPGVIRPDLTIGQTSWSPATYLPPAKLKFTCQIRNDGIAAAGPFHVYCFGAGSLWPQVAFIPYGLKRNESTMCSFDFQYSAGPAPASVWVDYCNEVAERNETNNASSSAPELEASAYDFYAQDLWLEYDPNSILGQLLGTQHVTQPVGGLPVLMKGVVGYRNKVDKKPLSYSINVYFDGVIQKTYKVTIPANGTVEISHPVVLPGGDHRLKIGASGISVDKTWAGNELERTFHWRTTAKAPYRHVYFAIGNYAALGDASNLSQSINEGRRFANRLVALGHPHTYHAENTAVNWDDWTGGPSARANNADIAYFVGHGNSDGPFYSSKGFNGNTYMMVPSQYRLGRDNGGQNTFAGPSGRPARHSMTVSPTSRASTGMDRALRSTAGSRPTTACTPSSACGRWAGRATGTAGRTTHASVPVTSSTSSPVATASVGAGSWPTATVSGTSWTEALRALC